MSLKDRPLRPIKHKRSKTPTARICPPSEDEDLDLTDINIALGLTASSIGTMSLDSSNGSFPQLIDFPSSASNLGAGGMQRQAPSPLPQQQANNSSSNGVGVGLNGMGGAVPPVPAGQLMDVAVMYQKLLELSEVLKENRERTQGIVAGAEELAVSVSCSASLPYSLYSWLCCTIWVEPAQDFLSHILLYSAYIIVLPYLSSCLIRLVLRPMVGTPHYMKQTMRSPVSNFHRDSPIYHSSLLIQSCSGTNR